VEGNPRAGVHRHPDRLVRQPFARREEEAAGLLNVSADPASQRRTRGVRVEEFVKQLLDARIVGHGSTLEG
jgi:hypothetical protein